jgi:signal peptidase I
MSIKPRTKLKDFIKRILLFRLRKRWLKIEGNSMIPFLSDGQYVLLDSDYYTNNPIRRGDIVAFRILQTQKKILIKRVVALPKDIIEFKNKKLYVNNEESLIGERFFSTIKNSDHPLFLDEDEYFLLGDNPENSLDSRKMGSIPFKDIEGLVWLRLWPPKLL